LTNLAIILFGNDPATSGLGSRRF